jgi:hypothetical protein
VIERWTRGRARRQVEFTGQLTVASKEAISLRTPSALGRSRLELNQFRFPECRKFCFQETRNSTKEEGRWKQEWLCQREKEREREREGW